MAENKLHVIYRISDKGHPKPKLSNGGKGSCLENALKYFGGGDYFHVIADNCAANTIDALKSAGLDLEITSNGNAGTCRYIFDTVINRYSPEDNLYLLEDDYLHLPGSREAILEGLDRSRAKTRGLKLFFESPSFTYVPSVKVKFSPAPSPRTSFGMTRLYHAMTGISTIL
mgnify:CR=1 FL=1